MLPLLLITFWAFTLGFERFFYLRKIQLQFGLIDQVREHLKDGHLDQARLLVEGIPGAIPHLLSKGVFYITYEEDMIEDRLRQVIYEEMVDLEKHMATINTFAGLMTLLGLLGAVSGMIAVFNEIALVGAGDAHAVAKGLSEVLISTQTGLGAAIPTLFVHNYLSNRVDRIVLELKRASSIVLFMSKLNKRTPHAG